MILLFLLSLFFAFNSDAQAESTKVFPLPVSSVNFNDVHVWPNSKCDICHVSSSPDSGSSELVITDQSLLCESCHIEADDITPSVNLQNNVVEMSHHPIKFSPLDLDSKTVNHRVIAEDNHFYISGNNGKIPIFGKTKETAVVECTSCHDPHGRSGIGKLLRIDNAKSGLCFFCHLY